MIFGCSTYRMTNQELNICFMGRHGKADLRWGYYNQKKMYGFFCKECDTVKVIQSKGIKMENIEI